MLIHNCANRCSGRKPVSIALLHAFTALGCSLVMSVAALSQTTTPDLEITDWREPGAPRPNGQIYAWFRYNASSGSVTADAVLYRGSVAAGTAAETLRRPLTFVPAGYATFDSGPTIPFNEGDIFTVCINPDHTVAESNYNNNCHELVVSASYTDLGVGVADISMSPLGPAVGQPVTVRANIHNPGEALPRAPEYRRIQAARPDQRHDPGKWISGCDLDGYSSSRGLQLLDPTRGCLPARHRALGQRRQPKPLPESDYQHQPDISRRRLVVALGQFAGSG